MLPEQFTWLPLRHVHKKMHYTHTPASLQGSEQNHDDIAEITSALRLGNFAFLKI